MMMTTTIDRVMMMTARGGNDDIRADGDDDN